MAFTAQQSVSGSLTNAVSALITFGYNANNTPIRYAYFAVTNEDVQGSANMIYVRTDGQAASTTGGDFNNAVAPGETLVIANALPLWYQSQAVMIGSFSGAAAYQNPLGAGMGSPSEVQPMGSSPLGLIVNPGSAVSVATAGTGVPYTVTGTG